MAIKPNTTTTESDPLQEYVEDPLVLARDVQKIAPMLTPRALANMRLRYPDALPWHRILSKTYYRKSSILAFLESTREGGEAA